MRRRSRSPFKPKFVFIDNYICVKISYIIVFKKFLHDKNEFIVLSPLMIQIEKVFCFLFYYLSGNEWQILYRHIKITSKYFVLTLIRPIKLALLKVVCKDTANHYFSFKQFSREIVVYYDGSLYLIRLKRNDDKKVKMRLVKDEKQRQ